MLGRRSAALPDLASARARSRRTYGRPSLAASSQGLSVQVRGEPRGPSSRTRPARLCGSTQRQRGGERPAQRLWTAGIVPARAGRPAVPDEPDRDELGTSTANIHQDGRGSPRPPASRRA